MKYKIHAVSLAALFSTALLAAEPDSPARGRQFVGFDSLTLFATSAGPHADEIILTSPVITSRIHFDEVVVSWNAALARNAFLVVEARAVYPDKATKYYNLGTWSPDSESHPRQSESGQKNEDGDVATDVLKLTHPAERLQVRLKLTGVQAPRAALKFLGIALTDTSVTPEPLPADHDAWGKLIPVPERTQMLYPNGKTLCSPTTVSMILCHWASVLKRSDLDHTVPETAQAIYDSGWQGAGNWPFNMAYAGSFPGMRAYVARLSDVSELEAWIAQGLPVGLSVDYDRLRAKGPGPNGHLVVLVGFTEQGDPIINDPGTTQHVRKTFLRKNLINAWASSHNTAYLVYPEKTKLPDDPYGHWDSPQSHQATVLQSR